MNLDPDSGPPSGNVWRPEWIPPICPPECRTACPALFGIWTYQINVIHGARRVNPRTLRPERRDIIQIGATEWYFDRYGCRKFDSQAAAEIAGAAVATTIFEPFHDTLELKPYWEVGRKALQDMGVPPPGHVRILPRGATGLAALAAAASR